MSEKMSQDAPITGDPRVDREHRELLRCVNDFNLARGSADGHDGAARALHFLLHHAITHFSLEEERMEASGYPDLPSHRLEHHRLLDDVRGLVAQFHGKAVSIDVMGRFLTDRFLNHLMGGDRRFAEWKQNR